MIRGRWRREDRGDDWMTRSGRVFFERGSLAHARRRTQTHKINNAIRVTLVPMRLIAQTASRRVASFSSHQPLSSSSSRFSKRRATMATNAVPSSSPSEPVAPLQGKKWWTPDTVAVVTGGES
jgi:hypothetical protein